MPYFFCFLLLTGLVFQSRGQNRITLESYAHFGTILSPASRPAGTDRFLGGGEFTVSRPTTGTKVWQLAHGLPRIGLTARVRKVGNSIVYGHDFAVVPFVEFNLWRLKKATLQVKHGTGLAYASRKFDAINNPDNQLIGSHFNFVSLLNAGFLLHGSESFDLKTGVELSHASNGNFAQPNTGLNTVAVYAGLRYYPGKKKADPVPAPLIRRRHQWRWAVGGSVGFYDAPEQGRLQTVPQLNASVLFQHDLRFRALAGVETFFENRPQIGLRVGEEVLIGHLGIQYLVGLTVLNPPAAHPVYEKIGIAWYPQPLTDQMAHQFYVGTALKANGFRAAFVELTSGYVF